MHATKPINLLQDGQDELESPGQMVGPRSGATAHTPPPQEAWLARVDRQTTCRGSLRLVAFEAVLLVLIVAAFVTVPLHAGAAKEQTSDAQQGAGAQPTSTGAQVSRTEIVLGDEQLVKATAKLLDRLSAQESPPKPWWEGQMIVAVGTVAISQIVPGFLIWRQRKRDEQVDRLQKEILKLSTDLTEGREKAVESHRTRLQVARDMLRFRERILRDFYAPLMALTQESRSVTEKLVYQFESLYRKGFFEDRSPQYEFKFMTLKEAGIEVPVALENDIRLCVREPNGQKWELFRTLDFMAWILRDESCAALLDRIVGIGQKTTDLIQDQLGVAATDETPSRVFGEYLAHFDILKAMREKPPKEAFAPGSHRVGYFPRGLDKAIVEGYERARSRVRVVAEQIVGKDVL